MKCSNIPKIEEIIEWADTFPRAIECRVKDYGNTYFCHVEEHPLEDKWGIPDKTLTDLGNAIPMYQPDTIKIDKEHEKELDEIYTTSDRPHRFEVRNTIYNLSEMEYRFLLGNDYPKGKEDSADFYRIRSIKVGEIILSMDKGGVRPKPNAYCLGNDTFAYSHNGKSVDIFSAQSFMISTKDYKKLALSPNVRKNFIDVIKSERDSMTKSKR